LRSGLGELTLDAAGLDVSGVTWAADAAGLPFSTGGRQLSVTLPEALSPGERGEVCVTYSARPKGGLYFFPATEDRAAQAWNYGEGGLHYAWIPLYNDTNERFSVDFELTVARPFTAVSNGKLLETRDNPDGTRTFHWAQEEPIPNYLLALDVGEFARVPLEPARAGKASIPVAVWGPPGTEEQLAYTFRNTTRMVEFFSEVFGYPYPWPKYDQITLREFDWAMETTTMVGFSETYQRRENDPVDSQPSFNEAHPTWTTEDTISHELAHHWFGDLVTCRSLASLWLNESFATFAHTLWNGQLNGEDDLTYQRWRYQDRYLAYVAETGEVRPLEFFRYASPTAMYQEETTYLKGALVLHLLRHLVGDPDFYGTLAAYLRRHEFGSVESADLLAAFRDTAGRDLGWFFEDWIVGGGGHPRLEVSYQWLPEREVVDLTVTQVQAELPFENLFRLPVDVEIVTASGRTSHEVELADWTTHASFDVEGGPPLAVTFDKGGFLVAEVSRQRSLREVLFQLESGGLAEQLRAARQIATDFPRRPASLPALASVLENEMAHWGLRQEAARDLGSIGGPEAFAALATAISDSDRRVRRAAALGLAQAGGESAARALRNAIESDPAEDVVGVAAAGLGSIHAEGAREFLEAQLDRESRWSHAIRLGALLGLAELEDPELVPVFERFTRPGYPSPVRLAAVDGWSRAGSPGAALAERLRELAYDRTLYVRLGAIERLGTLHRAEDLPFLQKLAAEDPDPSLAQLAREAAEEIQAFRIP